jgi:outer membrane protein assembly factor BamB
MRYIMKKIKIVLIGALSTLLCACSGFFDKDNTPPPSPLVNFTPEARIHTLWNTSTGNGTGKEYLKLMPALNEQTLFTASHSGTVTATNKNSGKTRWQVNTGHPITAGPTAANNLVFIGDESGNIIALSQDNGGQVWKTKVSSEILAAPTAAQGKVLVKTIDGKLTALNDKDGTILWTYDQTEPSLILRGSSAPQIHHNDVIVGFANGNLAKLSLNQGTLLWQEAVAIPEGNFAILRMIDIDADPIIYSNRIYVATYQGRIAALDLNSGKSIWTHDISSYTGSTADNNKVYITDAKSHIWAFDANNGTVNWRQNELEARNTTGPVTMGNYIVVGDEEGYLHWLNKQDGHFVARVRVNSSGILATPVVDNNIIYVVSRDGHVAAYTFG